MEGTPECYPAFLSGLVAHRLIADDPYCLFQCLTGREVVVVGFCLHLVPPGLLDSDLDDALLCVRLFVEAASCLLLTIE